MADTTTQWHALNHSDGRDFSVVARSTGLSGDKRGEREVGHFRFRKTAVRTARGKKTKNSTFNKQTDLHCLFSVQKKEPAAVSF